ncbi:MAG: fibronectin type III domain-containing protein [Turicibacter sp.]|nr:fibronectin type III domain-containing protein [Turicibacter sp.]
MKIKKKLFSIGSILFFVILMGCTNRQPPVPPTPQGLSVGMATHNEIAFSWHPVDEAYNYVITRNGNVIGETTDITFWDDNLQANTTYVYQVQAQDANGNLSELSDPLNAMTAISATAPEPPRNLHTMGETEDSIDLMWVALDEDPNVSHYEIFRDGVLIHSLSERRWVDTGLNPQTEYTYFVVAVNFDGEASIPSNELVISTVGIGERTEGNGGHEHSGSLPTTPRNLHTMGETENSVDLMWSDSEDDSIMHYQIFRNGIYIATTTNRRFLDTGLEPETEYHYFVISVSHSHDISEQSNELIVTTAAVGESTERDHPHGH